MPFIFLQIQSSGWRRDSVHVGLLRQVISLNYILWFCFLKFALFQFDRSCTVFPVRPHKRLASSQTHFVWDYFYSIFFIFGLCKTWIDSLWSWRDTFLCVFSSSRVKISKYFMINVPQISALSFSLWVFLNCQVSCLKEKGRRWLVKALKSQYLSQNIQGNLKRMTWFRGIIL